MKKVSVIEDNSSIRKLFVTLLKKDGYEVSDFASGESALSELQGISPDLIVMDILLPDVNGTDLIGRVRLYPECAGIPIIAVTGFATEADEAQFKELGFNGYLSKPINAPNFLSTIKSHLG
jgi:CheY-like chemotaxis protein